MKTPIHPNTQSLIACLSAALLLDAGPASAQDTWTGSSGTRIWSDGGNWSSFPNPPGAFDDVRFDINGFTNAQGLVNNIVDVDFTISTLGYDLITTNGFHTTQINPGRTLSII